MKIEDLGVVERSTRLPLTRVERDPLQGQYSFSDGVYTFSSQEDGRRGVLISYCRSGEYHLNRRARRGARKRVSLGPLASP